MLDSKIGTAKFLAALTTGIEQSGVFSAVHDAGDSAYDLEVTVMQVKPSYSGLNVVMHLTSRWRLVHAGRKQVVFDEIFERSYKATVGEALAGITRIRKANEGAARESIREGIARLSRLDL
jgi:hypothetical protein